MTRILMITALALNLAGCTTLQGYFTKTAPDFKLDEAEFIEAVYLEEETTETSQITPFPTKPEPIILMPGQLKPIQNASLNNMPDVKPHQAIDQANQSAAIQPMADNYINAIQIYPYSVGALYQVYCAPKQVTDIALQPGEELMSVSAGDTVRWVLGDTVSGSGTTEQVHILVKPISASLATNMVITTSKRTYHLEMTSFYKTYMAAVSWHYPNEAFGQLRAVANVRASKHARLGNTSRTPHGLQLDRLNFRYEVAGDEPHWRPIQAFDDGRKVYIQFPARLDQGEAPPLFVIGRNGKSQLVNYRINGTYYVVDRLFAAAELRLGEEKQEVVRITRISSSRAAKL